MPLARNGNYYMAGRPGIIYLTVVLLLASIIKVIGKRFGKAAVDKMVIWWKATVKKVRYA